MNQPVVIDNSQMIPSWARKTTTKTVKFPHPKKG